MKTFLTLLLSIAILSISNAQELELPFFDDFEETISNDASFANWTTENLEGWQYWHIVPGQHMRFENNDLDQNDWLITKKINCAGKENLKVNFSYFYSANKVPPRFYYTNQYNGNASQSTWTELNFSFEENKDQWYSSEEYIIENPGDAIYFAFQYEVAANAGAYFLLDNFSVAKYVAPPTYEKVGSTEHFEFYSTLENGASYWSEISESLDDWYAELCSYWDRPGRELIYESDVPVKIYLATQQEIHDAIGIDIPEWKYGYYQSPNKLYVSVPPENDPVYNGSYITVCKNVLSQLILKKRFQVEGNSYLPSYFSEAFAQYYCGYRPNKNAILQAISDYGGYPNLSDIKSLEGFDTTYRKDLLVFYVESQALSRLGIQGISSDGYETLYLRHFKYFYELDDDLCIQLGKQTEHFDLYYAEQDSPFMSQIASKLEEKYTRYTNAFDLDIKHKFSCIIYPSVEAGIYSLVYSDDYNGGSGWSGDLLDFLSPTEFGGGLDEALKSLIPHEFFHAFHFNLVTHLFRIAPFNSEGMAELMAYEGENKEYLKNYSWYFENGFNRFESENGREPKLADIMPDKDGYMSVYTYGQAFWHFMVENYTDYPTIKEFFKNGEDWGVFDVSYNEIDAAYIIYLKSFFEETIAKPQVSTLQPSSIKNDRSTLNGKVTNDGESTITQRGFYWSSTNTNPGYADHVVTVNGTIGDYSFELSGLSPETTYFYRAFAANSEGTSLGEVKQFTTSQTTSTYAKLPFLDDFSHDYENWTTYSITGDDQWHLSGDDGIDGGKCARFYITTNPLQVNDDWLVSHVFNTEDISNIAIEFKFLYHGNGMIPEFYYATSFTGDVSTTDWSEIDNSFWKNEGNWNDARIEIESPGNTLTFAIRYQSTTESSQYILIDNFSIENFAPIVYEKVGSSEHFEFYTSIAGETDYWLDIEEGLEKSFQKYCGIWNIQGKKDFIDKSIKTKIYYTEKTNIPFVKETTPETKSGFFDRETKTIYLSPLNTAKKEDYYESLEGVAVNTFAGYAKTHQLFRDHGYDAMPNYFTEGFGLYEQGIRPRLDSIIKAREGHPYDFTHEDLDEMNVFGETYEKDIIVSYVEAQIVGLLDYYGTAPYSSHIAKWNKHLIYFYDTTDVVRIKKYASNDHFDIYCSSRDTMFIDSFFVWLERPRQFYIDSFQIEVNRKYNLVIYYDEKTGVDMTGYGNWNGGAGGLNISPHNFDDGIDGFPWLLAHEFGHVYNSVIYPEMPFGFYHEGMANFSGYIQYNDDWRTSRYKIEAVLFNYLEKYGAEPTLDDFINNPHEMEGANIDPYYFGLEFIRYLYETEGLLKISTFFNQGMDFSIFSQSYEEIEEGYLKRLKLYRNLSPKDTLIDIPFAEPFQNYKNGWTKPSYNNEDNWKILLGNAVEDNCAIFYTGNGKNIALKSLKSWLVSPALNAKNMNQISLSFDCVRIGEGIELDVFYTNKFEGNTDSTTWTHLKSIEMLTDREWSNTGEISINNPPDSIFIGMLVTATGKKELQLRIDNLEVDGPLTNSKLIASNKNSLKIYPNPITSESVISFQTKTIGNVNLSIFDIQGRKICTLLNENLNAGKHSVPVSNHLPAGGIYFCKLQTPEGVSTIKLIR